MRRVALFATALAFVSAPAFADKKKKPAADTQSADDEDPITKPDAKKKAKKKPPHKVEKLDKLDKVDKKKPKKKKKEPEPEIEIEPEPAPPPPKVEIEPEVKPLDEPAQPKADAEVKIVAPQTSGSKRFYIRAGVAILKPLSTSRPMELADVDGAASLAVQNGPIAGSGATVGSATIPAIIVGYNITDHIGIETVLGVPFTVKFQATGTLADQSIAPTALGIPTGVPPLGPELGEAKAAPPLLTLVYKFLSPGAAVRPFVGAGAAVLFAYGAKVTNPMLTAVSQPEMSISPAPGLVFQTGAEVKLSKSWFARLDVKYIAFMLARAEVKHIQVQTPSLPLFDTVEVGTAKMSVWVNPLIIQAGIGADF